MRAWVRTWAEQGMEEAQMRGSAFVPKERNERLRMRRIAQMELAVEVLPGAYVQRTFWEALNQAQQMRVKMRILFERQPALVFAGPSAAVAYGLPVSNRYLDRVWLATTSAAHLRSTDIVRRIIVSGDEPTQVDGFWLTSLARTVGDCLRIMDFRSGLAIADAAVRVAGTSPTELIRAVEAACPHMRGLPRMRQLMSLVDARAESGGESIARATMLELGIAPPELQLVFPCALGDTSTYRVDFAWQCGKGYILGELDGFAKYVDTNMTGGREVAEVLEAEHRRQSLIEANEKVLRVVRFSFGDVMRTRNFLELLLDCGVPRTYARDDRVVAAGGILRCRDDRGVRVG